MIPDRHSRYGVRGKPVLEGCARCTTERIGSSSISYSNADLRAFVEAAENGGGWFG
jgi:hypothetical protein